MAYKKLYGMGYRNLNVLDEGIAGWVEQGFPTEGWRAGADAPPPGHGRPAYHIPLRTP